MASFRILDPLQVYFNLNGSAPASGGYIRFFEGGTSDPKSVFGDPALSIDNGPRVNLDAAGRPLVEAWGDGTYKLRLYDQDDTLIKETDHVQAPGGAAAQIPALVPNAFLSTDGAILIWELLTQIPDVAGQLGKVLSNDGTALLWKEIVIPVPPAPDIVISGDRDTGSLRLGTSNITTKVLFQWGSAQTPNSGQRQAAVDVQFPTAYNSAAIWVGVSVTSSSLTSNGLITAVATPVLAPDKFSAHFDSQDFGNNASKFNQPIPFRWLAVGLVTVNP